MARHRNQNWNLADTSPEGTLDNSVVQLALLMDIRDELQALNRLLNCHNVRGGFEAMQRIDRRLKQRLPLK